MMNEEVYFAVMKRRLEVKFKFSTWIGCSCATKIKL